MPRGHDITVYLIGFEKHKDRPDLSDDSGFWLRVSAGDVAPFVEAFKTSPGIFHDFQIEQRVGRKTRTSMLKAQIVKIAQGPEESRVLIRPDVPFPLT